MDALNHMVCLVRLEVKFLIHRGPRNLIWSCMW
jgi:hypothetical protein